MSKTRLTHALIDTICELVRLRLRWKDIAAAIGFDRRTLQNGRRQGAETKKGIQWKLVQAIAKTEAEVAMEYARIVQKEAIEGHDKVSVKEVEDKDGNIIRTETTTVKGVPNAELALKLLERMLPEQWGPVPNINLDYRETLRERGLDPEVIKRDYYEYLKEHQHEIPFRPNLN